MTTNVSSVWSRGGRSPHRRAALAVFLLLAAHGAASGHPNHAPEPLGPEFGIDASTSRSLAWLEERLSSQPDDVMALSALAGARLRLARQTTRHDDFEAAAGAFERLLAQQPDSQAARLGLAHARMGQHRFNDAVKWARAALVAEPASAAALAVLGDAKLALGHVAEASLIAEELERRDITLESLARLSLVREAQGRHEEARVAMTEAVQAGQLLHAEAGQIAWCESMLGEFALARGDAEGADAFYAAALEKSPDLHHVRMRRVEVMVRRGQLEEAETAMMALAAQFPLPRYWVTLAEIHLRHGEEADLKAAESLFARAAAQMSDEVDRGDLGHVREYVEFLIARGGASEQAVRLAKLDLDTVRQDAEAFEVLAWAQHHAGATAEAATTMREALARNPGNARALRRAATISRELGRDAESASLMARARAIDPTDGGTRTPDASEVPPAAGASDASTPAPAPAPAAGP